MTVDYSKHPSAGTRSIEEIEEEIFDSAVKSGVLVTRGSWFRAEKDKPPSGLYFRTTFATATAEGMDEAISRFAKALQDSFGRK